MRIISEIKKTEFITKDKSNQYNSKNNKENSTVNNSNMTENLEIAPVKSEKLTESYSQKEQVNINKSLKQYGIRDSDIARLQNGEITLEALMKEIDKDPDRKREVLESQALLNSITNLENTEYRINQKVYNLEELDNYIKKLESELNGYTNDLHKDEELNALAKIINFLENGVDLDSALESGTVAYMYKDANGEKHYVYEQPIGSMMNDQINAGKHYIIGSDGRTYESLNYKEMYGESEYIKELRNNLTKGNSNFFEKTFLNQNDEVYKYDKNSDQSKYIESLKEKISNSQKESNELEAKIYELTKELETCKYVSTNVKEEVDYFMDNINPYVMQDDFLANNNFNNDSTKTVNDLIAKYNFSSSLSQKNYVSAPTINISDQKEKVDIISCIINGKENISNGFLITGNSAYMLDSSDDIISHYASWSKLMSDKEVEIFNYIYNTDTSANKDKAYQYLKDISKELDNRWLQNRTKEDEEFAGSHHTLASLGSIVVTPVEGISALCYSLKEYANEKLHPEDKTAQIYRTDVYSSGNVWRSKVAKDIAETKGDLASFIYSTGMSMADSVSLIALSAATGGTATPVLSAGLMGSRAYVSTLNDSLDRGLSDGQAVLLAASSAVVETAMESYSVGHLMNLEEHLGTGVVKIVDDIAKDISNPQVANIVTKGFYVIANSVCQGVAEGEEELATEVLNYVSDIFVSKDSSQFCESIQYYLDNGYTEDQALYATLNNFKGQLIQAFAGGFASGLCFGSFGGINSTINTSYGISQELYTNLQGDTKAQQFANALEINQQQLSELEAAAKKNGQNLTQSEIELLQNGTIEQQASKALKNKLSPKNILENSTSNSKQEGIMDLPKLEINSTDVNIEEIKEINKTLTLWQYNNLDNKVQQALTKLNHQEFNLEDFMNKDIGDGGVLLITDNQSVMTDNFTTKHEKEGGEHGYTVESIYKAIYGSNYNLPEDGLWQYNVVEKGDICVQLCDDIDSPVWIPNKLSQNQFVMLEAFNKKIKEVYQNNPGYFDEHPMKFSSNLNIDTTNNLDAILEEAKKRVTKKESYQSETIVGDTIAELNNDITQESNIINKTQPKITKFNDFNAASINDTLAKLTKHFGDFDSNEEIHKLKKGKTVQNVLKELSGQEKLEFEDFINNSIEGNYLSLLTPNELKCLAIYTGGNYTEINEYNRHNMKNAKIEGFTLEKLSMNIDSALSKYEKFAEPIKLYRGVDCSAFTAQKNYKDIFNGIDIYDLDAVYYTLKQLEGLQFHDDAYMSTSPAYDCSFAKYPHLPIVLEIYDETGTHGAYINEISEFHNTENEYLLKKRTSLQMIEVLPPAIDKKGNEKIVIKCQVVDNNITPNFTTIQEAIDYLDNLSIDESINIDVLELKISKLLKDKYITKKGTDTLGIYYDLLNLTNLTPDIKIPLIENLIQNNKFIREAIYKEAFEEMKSKMSSIFNLSEERTQELLDCILGEEFIDKGYTEDITFGWSDFESEIEDLCKEKVKELIIKKEPVLWSGIDDEFHPLMNDKYTTVENSTIGENLYVLDIVFPNYNSKSIDTKAPNLEKFWGVLSTVYAQACCEIEGKTSIKFLYPTDMTNPEKIFGNLFKSIEFPIILEESNINNIIITSVDQDSMREISQISIDISDISVYYNKKINQISDIDLLEEEVYNMLLNKVKSAIKQ